MSKKFSMREVVEVVAEFAQDIKNADAAARYTGDLFGFVNDIHFKMGKRNFTIYENASSFTLSEGFSKTSADLKVRFTSLKALRRALQSL